MTKLKRKYNKYGFDHAVLFGMSLLSLLSVEKNEFLTNITMSTKMNSFPELFAKKAQEIDFKFLEIDEKLKALTQARQLLNNINKTLEITEKLQRLDKVEQLLLEERSEYEEQSEELDEDKEQYDYETRQ